MRTWWCVSIVWSSWPDELPVLVDLDCFLISGNYLGELTDRSEPGLPTYDCTFDLEVDGDTLIMTESNSKSLKFFQLRWRPPFLLGSQFFKLLNWQMTRFMFLKYYESIVASWKYCYQQDFALSVEIAGLTLSVGFFSYILIIKYCHAIRDQIFI